MIRFPFPLSPTSTYVLAVTFEFWLILVLKFHGLSLIGSGNNFFLTEDKMVKSTKKLVTNAFIIISPTSALDQKTWLFLDKFHELLDLFHNAKSWELYSRRTEVMLICQRWLLHWLLRQMYVNRYRFLFPIS